MVHRIEVETTIPDMRAEVRKAKLSRMGFSYGDDTGSGNAFANRIRHNLWDKVQRFVEEDNLVLGICNGFQIMVNLGLLPAVDNQYGAQEVALVHNETARYLDHWVDVTFPEGSVWTDGVWEA